MTRPGARFGAAAALAAAAVVFAVLLARLPETLVFWDEIQLAYGVLAFDLARHQPHPPGYALFVWAGRALLPLAGDPALALRWVSAGATAAFAALAVGRGPAGLATLPLALFAAAAALFAVLSPLTGRYGVVALPYAAEGAVWLGWLLAFARRPAGARLLVLAAAGGLAAGLRPTLGLWCALFLLWGACGRDAWIPRRRLPALAAAALAGAACWIVPLALETGGVAAWREASAALVGGNIWLRSPFAGGLDGFATGRLLPMLADLARGLGLLGPLALAVALQRARGADPQRGRMDALAGGAALAFVSYAALIYDTPGYLVATAMPLAAWTLRGAARWAAQSASLRGAFAAAAAACAAAALLAAGSDGLAPHERYDVHDALLRARFGAVAGTFEPGETVLVTSQEYRDYGLRHAGHYLPGFPVLQLVRDDFFAIVSDDRPYLVSQGRELRAVGPADLDLAALLPDAHLRQVVYLLPPGNDGFVTPSCAPLSEALPVGNGESLRVLRTQAGWQVRARRQRLHCLPPGPEPIAADPGD